MQSITLNSLIDALSVMHTWHILVHNVMFQENLRALQARDRAMAKKQKEAEEQWCQDIEAAGGNPSEELIKKHRLEQFERQKE